MGFGSVSDTTDVNLCNKEGGLTFSSSSLGMTPQKALMSVGSQLYTYKNTTAFLPEAISADIQNKFTLLRRQGREHCLDILSMHISRFP